MRKAFAPIFILLLLTVSLWGGLAWMLGLNTQQAFIHYINSEKQADSIFDLELIEYKRSIFTAKAKIKLQLNPRNNFAQLLEEFFTNDEIFTATIKISHGPLLVDKSDLQLGSSAWLFDFNQPPSESDESDKHAVFIFDNELNTRLVIDLEDHLNYHIPLKINKNKVIVKGVYHLTTRSHQGSLAAKRFKFQGSMHSLALPDITLQYQQNINLKNNILGLFAELKKVKYTNSVIDEYILADLKYSGEISLESNILNSINSVLLDFNIDNSKNNYPIEEGELKLSINDLNLEKYIQLMSHISQIQNYQQQTQWILEEQGEFPEGQDQIWQIQNNAISDYKELPNKVYQVVFKDNKKDINQKDKNIFKESNASVRFSFANKANNDKSSLSGAIFPSINNYSDTVFDIPQVTLNALIQVQAQVNLDQKWFQFISTRLPIKKPNFRLIYKQNKLLMQ